VTGRRGGHATDNVPLLDSFPSNGVKQMSAWFIDPRAADRAGLVAAGGDLSAPRILEAYRHGIFPFYYGGMEIKWRSPDPRAIIPIGGLHVSRSLVKKMRNTSYAIRYDSSFREVVSALAASLLLSPCFPALTVVQKSPCST
jgi:Leucyl/phenylalanyl-tRNA protein transferase